MEKTKVQRKYYLILLILVMSLFMINSSLGAGEHRIIIDFDVNQERIPYDVWRVDDVKDLTQEETDDYIGRLQRMNRDVLKEKYGSPFQGEENEKGQWVYLLSGPGLYYGRQQEGEGTGLVDFLVLVEEEKDLVLRPKPYQTKVRLTKYRNLVDENNRMANVSFEILDDEGKAQNFIDGQWVPEGTPGGSTSLVTDQKGEIFVTGLPFGKYEFFEKKVPGFEMITSQNQLKFELNRENAQGMIQITVINKEDHPQGGRKFFKTNEEEEGLEGAVFKLYRKEEDGSLTPVLQEDGTEYIIRSDENGIFEIDNLPYGDYVLVETKAPMTDLVVFEPLKRELSFTIDGRSGGLSPIIIINKESPIPPPEVDEPPRPDEPGEPEEPSKPPIPNPPTKPPKTPPSKPPSINVPKTGDIQIFLFTLGGLSLISMGLLIYKKPGKKEWV